MHTYTHTPVARCETCDSGRAELAGPPMNTATIRFFTLQLKKIPWSRFSGTFLASPIDFCSPIHLVWND